MGSYYADLNVSPTASAVEIQTAIDTLYNQWRQAVTHPEPGVVEEANRNLRVLEQMRATLADPAKRAGYDAGIGLGGAAGLADPTATINRAPAPPRPSEKAATSGRSATSDLWVCPKCATDNPPQTRHCFKCGSQLVRKCPNCGQMASLVATGFCGHCGAPYALAAQILERRQQRAEAGRRIASLAQELKDLNVKANGLVEPSPPNGVYLLGVLLGAISPLFLFSGISAFSVIATLLIVGGAVYLIRYKAKEYRSARTQWKSEVNAISHGIVQIEDETKEAVETIDRCDFEIARLEKQLSLAA